MNEPLSRQEPPSWEGRARYLALSPHPVLSFLHEPDVSRRRGVAVLFCPPFGWDDMCSYRARRNWAQSLARAGYPTVRFDLPSTGDSGGGPGEPARVAAWIDATAQMIARTRERTGADRLAVFGLGLGGLLAWQAIADGAEVEDLLLWAVPSSGRALLREQRVHAQMVAAGYAPEHQQTAFPEDQDLELIGYRMTAETAADLRALKPTRHQPDHPPERVLLLSRDQIPVAPDLQEYFARACADVCVETTGDLNALFAVPQLALTPVETIERSIAWLGEGDRSHDAGPSQRETSSSGAPGPHPELESVELEYEGKRVRETVVETEVGGYRISGILTSPVDAPPADVTAVLLSAGALRRTGLSRVWVELARRWAGAGVSSLRLDQPGIGDSSGDERSLVSNHALYDPQSTQIVLEVLEWLTAQGLPERYVMVGSCAGAYWSLHAALADPRIVAALMITLYAFEFSDDLVVERTTARALSALRGRFWRRLLRRDVTAAEVRTKLRSVSPGRLGGRFFASAERGQTKAMERMFDALRDQGTYALFLVCDEQRLLRQVAPHGHFRSLARWPNVELERLASPDNLFRALPLQQQVHASLDRALDRAIGADVRTRLLSAPQRR